MRQDMTMDEVMEYQGRLYFMPRKKIREKTEELLEFCGLIDFRRRTVRKLSGGMKRKLMVCRALLTEPEILLLDEPAAGMNPNETAELMETIRFVRDHFGMTILLIEHDMKLVMGICEGICVLNYGRVIAKGTAEEIQKNPTVIEAYLGRRKEDAQ